MPFSFHMNMNLFSTTAFLRMPETPTFKTWVLPLGSTVISFCEVGQPPEDAKLGRANLRKQV